MELAQFSGLVIRWNALAQAPSTAVFLREALGALQALLPFSSAWWGTGVRGPRHPKIVQSYLHELPPTFLTDWQAICERDEFALAVQAAPGVTHLMVSDRDCDDVFRSFDRRYGTHSTLSTCIGDEDTGVGTFLSVYRHEGETPFTEAERGHMQLLIPHLMHAAQLRWRRNLEGRREGTLVAQADPRFGLIDASVEFCRQMLREWPQWPGGRLPEPLLKAVQRQDAGWTGRAVHIELAVRATGQVTLELTPRIGNGLSPKHERVAREYVAGFSYKEIARNLGLSPATVRTYLRVCYLKLGVTSKLELRSRMERGG